MPVDLVHLHPRLHQIVLDLGGPSRVESGARSHAHQQFLHANQHLPGFNPANPAGWSCHEYDEKAVWPIDDADNEASALLGGCWAVAVDFKRPYPHGHPELCWPISGEPWHAQLRPVCRSKRYRGMWRELPRHGLVVPDVPPPPPDPLRLGDRPVLLFAGERLS